MDLSKKKAAHSEGSFELTDPANSLVLMLIIVVLCAIPVTYLVHIESFGSFLTLTVIISLVLMLLTFRLTAVWNGIKFDLQTRKLSFQGGGLAANSVLDYLRPTFISQYFKRITVDLDDIQSISIDVDWIMTIESFFFGFGAGKSDKNKSRRLIKILNISGNFGTAGIKFKSQAKCDQAFSTLSYYLNLGSPVVVRD